MSAVGRQSPVEVEPNICTYKPGQYYSEILCCMEKNSHLKNSVAQSSFVQGGAGHNIMAGHMAGQPAPLHKARTKPQKLAQSPCTKLGHYFFPCTIVIRIVDLVPILCQLRTLRFDPKQGSWRIPVVAAGLASKFRAILIRLC